jgi:nucleotide-binding universal stress UspA family protein
MIVKDLAVFLDARASSDARLDIAEYIAIRYHAHVIGIHVELAQAYSEGATDSFARGAGIDDVIMRFGAAERAAVEAHRRRFDALAAAQQLGIEWRTIPLQATLRDVVPHARYADLVILPQSTAHDPSSRPFAWSSAELVLAAGAPCIVVPEKPTHRHFDERVVIAWNASREASRAVSDAMSFLADTREVIVVIVDPKVGIRDHGAEPGADIGAHLARHGVRARIERISADGGDAGEAIVRRASELDAELLVAGAYGHSRFTEFVLGSTTHTLLAQAPMPVFLSH